jgi:hypothetical protein
MTISAKFRQSISTLHIVRGGPHITRTISLSLRRKKPHKKNPAEERNSKETEKLDKSEQKLDKKAKKQRTLIEPIEPPYRTPIQPAEPEIMAGRTHSGCPAKGEKSAIPGAFTDPSPYTLPNSQTASRKKKCISKTAPFFTTYLF